jgi:hypothetical protein
MSNPDRLSLLPQEVGEKGMVTIDGLQKKLVTHPLARAGSEYYRDRSDTYSEWSKDGVVYRIYHAGAESYVVKYRQDAPSDMVPHSRQGRDANATRRTSAAQQPGEDETRTADNQVDAASPAAGAGEGARRRRARSTESLTINVQNGYRCPLSRLLIHREAL